MPTFRRLTAQEIADLQPRRGSTVDLTEYREFLVDLAPGQGGEVSLGTGDQRRTVKRRLTTAALGMGKKLRYRRSPDNVVRFEVQSGDS